MIEGRDIPDLFNILHDGEIESAEMKGRDCVLRVEIPYLAERIRKGFRRFSVSLKNSADFQLRGWMADFSKGTEEIVGFERIFEERFEILSAKEDEGRVSIACNIHDPNSELCGGDLSFHCDSAEVSDEAQRKYSIDELGDICEGYWDDWQSKRQKV